MEETWKQITGADAYYEISNLGRARIREHNDENGRVVKCKLITPYMNSSGYLQYVIKYDGVRKKKYAHRLVAEMFIENPYNLAEVDHIDDDKTNNCVDNLQWITRQDNMRKMFETRGRTGQTKYYCSCGREKSKESRTCARCSIKISRSFIPDKDNLLESVINYNANLSAIGRKYYVSDNTIKKWCKMYSIDVNKIRNGTTQEK